MHLKNSEHEIKKLYGKSHVLINRLIGRRYNNPLGESGFLSISNFCKISSKTNILDIGSGRGFGDIVLAKKFKCNITGIELSKEMCQEAKECISEAKLDKKIKLINQSFFDVKLDKKYDVVIGFDSFYYFKDRAKLFNKIKKSLKNNGIVVFCENYADNTTNKKVRELIKAWKIYIAGNLDWHRKFLEEMNFEILHFKDTTKKYLSYWEEIKVKTYLIKDEIIKNFSKEEYNHFSSSIDAIIDAVNSNLYGHMFCVCKHS